MDLRIADAEHGWFDFELALNVGDRALATEELVAHWLERDAPDRLLLPTEAGWLEVDTRPLQALRDLVESLFREKSLDGPVRLPPFRAAQLAEVEELDDRAAPLARDLAQRLRQFRGLQTVPVPAQLRCSLRPYQHEGLNWLTFLQQYGFGGILADDMGLGKTVQTLALLLHLKDTGQLQNPALILAPTSVAANWLRESAQFAPDLDVLLLHGPRRRETFATMDGRDVLVTTYPLLLRDQEQYLSRHFSVAVLDEAQAIKNPATKLTRAARALRADCRLCLSGTPLENHLGELWSLMDFALPGLLGRRDQFRQQFRTPIESQGDRERQQQLARRVAPFLLRRTKAEVVSDLPAKSETIEYVELAGQQRTLYEGIRVSMQKRVRDIVARKGMARSRIEFLDALLKLRQACIDPRLVKLDKAAGINESAKLDWLREVLPQLIEEGRRILVFSQFTEVLHLLEQELTSLRIAYSKLTGRTRKRQEAIDRFQTGEVPVFLISLKAGGSGLNLTAADVVIHVDPWWNPAVEAQASDRAHRIGQDKPVFVYKLIAAGTVEERIQQMQTEKRAMAETLFDDTGAAARPSSGGFGLRRREAQAVPHARLLILDLLKKRLGLFGPLVDHSNHFPSLPAVGGVTGRTSEGKRHGRQETRIVVLQSPVTGLKYWRSVLQITRFETTQDLWACLPVHVPGHTPGADSTILGGADDHLVAVTIVFGAQRRGPPVAQLLTDNQHRRQPGIVTAGIPLRLLHSDIEARSQVEARRQCRLRVEIAEVAHAARLVGVVRTDKGAPVQA